MFAIFSVVVNIWCIVAFSLVHSRLLRKRFRLDRKLAIMIGLAFFSGLVSMAGLLLHVPFMFPSLGGISWQHTVDVFSRLVVVGGFGALIIVILALFGVGRMRDEVDIPTVRRGK